MSHNSFAVCPCGEAAGHDGDECRAHRNPSGTIVCISCATIYPVMGAHLTRSLRAIARNFGSPKFQLGSETAPGTREYDAACLSGYDPNLSTFVRCSFKSKSDQLTATLNWDTTHNDYIENSDANAGTCLAQSDPKAFELVPERIMNCVKNLEYEGFRIRAQREGLLGARTIVMTCGQTVGQMGFVIGVTLELSWIA